MKAQVKNKEAEIHALDIDSINTVFGVLDNLYKEKKTEYRHVQNVLAIRKEVSDMLAEILELVSSHSAAEALSHINYKKHVWDEGSRDIGDEEAELYTQMVRIRESADCIIDSEVIAQ